MYLPKRHSLDTKTNRYKKPFLDFLLRSNLRVGRILGDLSGSFTCYEWNGHSQIDYFLTTPDIFPLFKYLTVEQKLNILIIVLSPVGSIVLECHKHQLLQIIYHCLLNIYGTETLIILERL